MVTEFVEGTGFEEHKGLPQADRDRIGEVIFRFYMGCLYRHRQFSGDPHPGNYLLLADGRLAFLDFGLFKRMDAAGGRAGAGLPACRGRGATRQTLHRLLAEAGFLPHPERVRPDILMEYVQDSIWWYTHRRGGRARRPRSPPR